MHKKATKKMGFKEAYEAAESMGKKSMHKMPDGKMMKNSAMNKRSK